MVLVLLGAPGAGKGTQATEITKEFGIPAISTGDLLRGEVKAKSDLGNQAKGYMDGGELVPDSLILAMLEKRIGDDDCKKGLILDGFPRNVAQAEALDGLLERVGMRLDAAVDIHVDKEVVVGRLSNRLACGNCKAGYNRLSKPPQQEGVCDLCGGELIQRDDDKEETIRNRLTVYEEKTAPLISFFQDKGLLRTIDGNREMAAIAADVQAELNKIGV